MRKEVGGRWRASGPLRLLLLLMQRRQEPAALASMHMCDPGSIAMSRGVAGGRAGYVYAAQRSAQLLQRQHRANGEKWEQHAWLMFVFVQR